MEKLYYITKIWLEKTSLSISSYQNGKILRKMRPSMTIKLPESTSAGISASAEIFTRVVTRAVVISNGVAGAENQCVGLVRALGLSTRQSLHVSLSL